MSKIPFHSGGDDAAIKEQLSKYRRDLVKKYGDSFLASIWISILVAKRKNELKHQNLHEVSKHY